jgi:hypothetical protein
MDANFKVKDPRSSIASKNVVRELMTPAPPAPTTVKGKAVNKARAKVSDANRKYSERKKKVYGKARKKAGYEENPGASDKRRDRIAKRTKKKLHKAAVKRVESISKAVDKAKKQISK